MDFNKQPNQIRLGVIALFILIIAAVRVILSLDAAFAPLANFSAVGAMALFGGAYFKNTKALAFPLLALLLSDLLIARFAYWGGTWTFLYEGAAWIYGAIALMVITGRLLMKQKRVANFLLSSLVIVFIHWIVTDFGVWAAGTMYPKTLAGFWACLVAAIPFERNFLIGTLVYGTLMFGAFEWFKMRYPKLRLAA
ncbi:MAG: hypothetical protein Sapg2KO_13910 [Saprospiraceae bacterium]